MLTKQEARKKVEGELTRIEREMSLPARNKDESDPYSDGVALIDGETLEFFWGWVFFYQSKRFLETRDSDFALWGNAPFIVNKNTGEIRVTGTSHPIDHYVREYESELGD